MLLVMTRNFLYMIQLFQGRNTHDNTNTSNIYIYMKKN